VAGSAGYSLVGCVVVPGFDFADFELIDLAYRREAPRSTASVSVGMKAERIDDCSRAT
jgi:predicted cupin superfamily sugar epimerase